MNLIEIASLFILMLSLAAIPSASVALVVTRSASINVSNGIAAAIGIVFGDLIFILIALLGLFAIAEEMAWLFVSIKYVGASYIIWFGITLLKKDNSKAVIVRNTKSAGSLITSFLAGLFLTLGDFKAIFFYISLFPSLVELGSLMPVDITIIVLVTIFAVGGVKVCYALAASKVITLSSEHKKNNIANQIAGWSMLGLGSYLVVKS